MRAILISLLFLSFGTTAYAKNVALTWADNSDNEEKFNIERKCGVEANFTKVGTAPANAASLIDPVQESKTAEIRCTYRVNAENAAGASGYTNEAPIVIPPSSPSIPASPTNLKAL